MAIFDNNDFSERKSISLIFSLAKRELSDLLQKISKTEVFRVRAEDQLQHLQSFWNNLSRTFRENVFRVKVEDDELYRQDIAKATSEIKAINSSLEKLSQQQTELDSTELIEEILESLREIRTLVENFKVEIPPYPKFPEIKIPVPQKVEFPIKEILLGLSQIKKSIDSIRLEVPPYPKQQEIRIPNFPKTVEISEGKRILEALESLNEALGDLPSRIKIPEVDFPNEVRVSNFPPQKYPLPVTSVNINPLRGFVKSRAVTVTTSLTPLPGEVLSYRRSIVVYNNSASTTVFIGGSDVTAAEGMPVPAGTYSPAIDAGPKMIVYGIVSTGSADVRTLELSNENIGG